MSNATHDMLDVEETTRLTYEGYIRNHIRPLLGELAPRRHGAIRGVDQRLPVTPEHGCPVGGGIALG